MTENNRMWRKLFLVCLLALPVAAQAQEPGEMLLEAGLVGGNTPTCPGHYLGVEGHIRYGVAAWGMVENYQCDGPPQTSSRVGLALRLAPEAWKIRPAVRSGLSYDDDGSVSTTWGGSLTFGHRYGARFIVDRWTLPNGVGLTLMQVGGFFSF